jgi:hypothetical protein
MTNRSTVKNKRNRKTRTSRKAAGYRAEERRCAREISAMEAQTDAAAWLTTLGIEDWRAEMRLLRREREDSA